MPEIQIQVPFISTPEKASSPVTFNFRLHWIVEFVCTLHLLPIQCCLKTFSQQATDYKQSQR